MDIQFSVTDWISLPQTVADYSGLDPGSIWDGPKAMYRDAVWVLVELSEHDRAFVPYFD